MDHGQKKAPAPATTTPASTERDIQMSPPVWSEDGAKAVIGARSADNKDRWIFALDPATGKTRTLVNIHDDAWVGGSRRGGSTLGWMKNDREVYFISEKTGYAQLYAVPFESGEPRRLTTGNWEVLNVHQSRDKSKFYLIANADGPADQFLYEMPGDGGPLTRISKAPGKHTAVLSPDEHWIADVYSYSNKPPDLYVQENRPQQDLRRLTTSPSTEFNQYPWQDPPIVTIPARDGVKVPARMYKPANYSKGGPAVIFVHGSGYLQNVDHKWSMYYHEYMFHHLLKERGYLVLDVDYRGSAGYGRDWRTAVYQHMGGKDLDDIVDAARYAAAQHGTDPKKIGLYGGSYGGFITLMAMFTQPDVFAAGAALRPVTDWATYNHGYTSDILNTPQTDPEAYRRSSPIFFAEGLQGALLICHGMVDTNVEFQDTVRLTQRLIELHKENWSVAPYPVEDHSFVLASSWTDEYKRILKLFETICRTGLRACPSHSSFFSLFFSASISASQRLWVNTFIPRYQAATATATRPPSTVASRNRFLHPAHKQSHVVFARRAAGECFRRPNHALHDVASPRSAQSSTDFSNRGHPNCSPLAFVTSHNPSVYATRTSPG